MVRRANTVAVCALAVFASLPAAGESPRTIVYANVGGERVQRAFERLHEALRKVEIFALHRVALRHDVISEEDPQQLEADLARIAATRPVAIIAPNPVIARAARKATSTIPIVFGSFESPVHEGLVESFARPGGNLTGFTAFLPLEEKHLELLKELAPHVRRVGILVDRSWMQQPHVQPAIQRASRLLRLELRTFVSETPGELDAALRSERGSSMDAWYVPHTELPFQRPDVVVESFERLNKPVVYARSSYVAKGGLASYQSAPDDSFMLWAKLLAQILAGVPAAIIPVERPSQFELALNLEATRRLGLHVPRSLLARVDRFY